MHSNSQLANQISKTKSSGAFFTWLKIAWRLFIRELGRGELTIIALSIILAVSSVMALSSVTDRVEQGIMSKSAAFIAADRDLQSAHPIDQLVIEKAIDLGLNTDKHIYFSSMAFAGDEMNITTVKAVTKSYPLRGELLISQDLISNKSTVKNGPSQGEVWLSKRLFYALSLDDTLLSSDTPPVIEVGELALNVTGIIESEPDAPFQVFDSGTRIIMNIDDVPATNVIQPGSRIFYRDLFAGSDSSLDELVKWLEPQLKPNQEIRDVKDGSTAMSSALTRAESFLMLAGVLGLLLAATAVAVATRLYSQRHFDSIAIFKTLGASTEQVRVVYLFQLVLITIFSVSVGIIIGSLIQSVAIEAMAGQLPSDLPPVGLKPLLIAIATGFVCALMFSIPSLLKLFSVPPLRVLRRNLGDNFATSIMAKIIMALTTVLLVLLYSQNLKLTGIVMAAGVVLVVVILLVSNVMIRLSRKIGTSVGGSAIKIALASLKRRASENTSQLIGFTLAIMLILILYSLENSIIKEWQQQLPEGTPNHFIINIAQHELDQVKQEFEQQEISLEQFYPIIRGRLTKINEEVLLQDDNNESAGKFTEGEGEQNREAEAETEEEKPEGRVGIGRELNLTYTELFPENNALIEGEWMVEGIPHQVSVEQRVAERLDIKLQDKLSFLIGAREVEVVVTSIRDVNWNSFQPNFFMIFSNDVVADFPATYITSFYIPKDQKLWVNKLVKQFPTLSVIDVEAMVQEIQKVIEQVSVSITFVLLVVVLAATLVLLAQVQSSLDERRKETVIYRTLGAKGSMIQNAITFEFLSLGAIAGLIAALVAEVSLYLLQSQMFNMDWVPHPDLWLIGPVSGAVFVALVGTISTRSLLKMTPSELIRQLS
ncbi:FtsX-like permease family protein [uncultured Psychrosphaera sp.]|uniref:ABC transporter permease n=1 Tax=uncultured Psychrosphaera sp. TaxID=1403522 RepID=UPI0026206DB5|nr:FtsX-like permease family protein [uncultured Psychrosphaera sp.]